MIDVFCWSTRDSANEQAGQIDEKEVVVGSYDLYPACDFIASRKS